MEPINYLAAMPQINLGQQLTQGLQAGALIGQIEQQRQAQQAAMQQQQQAQQLAQQYRTDVEQLFASPINQRLEGVQRLMLRYPQQREAFADMIKSMPEEQKRTELQDTVSLASVLNSGRYDIAEKMVSDRITAAKNAGQDATSFEALLDNIKRDPQSAFTTTLIYAAGLPGGDKALEALSKARTLPMTERKLGAEATTAETAALFGPRKAEQDLQQGVWTIENLKGQVADRVARLRLDTDKMQSDVQMKMMELGAASGKLSSGLEKVQTDSVVAATVADQAAAKSLSLADEIEKLGSGGFGTAATVAEKVAAITGSQDAWSAARAEFLRLKNSLVVKSLPPGPSTDRDITLFSAGFPPETADAAYLASWLRGMAKVQQREAAIESAKAEWIGEAGSLGKTKKDIEVAGVKVPAGATFDAFVRKFGEKKANERAVGDAVNIMSGRGYMRWANQ